MLKSPVSLSAILTADESGGRPLLLHGAKQSLADQPGGHSLSHLIAHYFTSKHILEAS